MGGSKKPPRRYYSYHSVITIISPCPETLYVTGFDKTRLPRTRIEIQFIAQHESHTLALSTRTNDGAIDGHICFYRRSFDDPVKPRRSTTGSMGPLMGTNKAVWGVKLLLMTVSAYQVDCGCFCEILNTQHCCLSPSGWYYPPSASNPPPTPTPHPPARPPPINFIHDIAGVVKNYHKS